MIRGQYTTPYQVDGNYILLSGFRLPGEELLMFYNHCYIYLGSFDNKSIVGEVVLHFVCYSVDLLINEPENENLEFGSLFHEAVQKYGGVLEELWHDLRFIRDRCLPEKVIFNYADNLILLENFVILPEWRGKGIGSFCLEFIKQQLARGWTSSVLIVRPPKENFDRVCNWLIRNEFIWPRDYDNPEVRSKFLYYYIRCGYGG